MIYTKKELAYYLERDALALHCTRKHPRFLGDDIWKFQRCLRTREYYSSFSKTKKLLFFIPFIFNRLSFKHKSLKLGLSIPINVFEEGLSIAHYGTIVVSNNAKIGKNCRIHEGVNIGSTNGSSKAPTIGNNVFIASGAKIIGDITIADDVAIGANAVVVKSITEQGTTWGGIPARKISNNNSHSNLSQELFK